MRAYSCSNTNPRTAFVTRASGASVDSCCCAGTQCREGTSSITLWATISFNPLARGCTTCHQRQVESLCSSASVQLVAVRVALIPCKRHPPRRVTPKAFGRRDGCAAGNLSSTKETEKEDLSCRNHVHAAILSVALLAAGWVGFRYWRGPNLDGYNAPGAKLGDESDEAWPACARPMPSKYCVTGSEVDFGKLWLEDDGAQFQAYVVRSVSDSPRKSRRVMSASSAVADGYLSDIEAHCSEKPSGSGNAS